MKTKWTTGAAQLAVALAALGAGPALAQSVEEQVSSAYASWDQAFNSGDAGKIAVFYTEDTVFLPPTHDVINGPGGVEKFFDGVLGMGVKGHKLELIDLREEGDTVIAAAKWSADGKDAQGADQPWGGVATTVFERQDDGSLKLLFHTFN
jgi:ketosteroid isomerase-like protein